MTGQELIQRLLNASDEVRSIENELNEIDARFGDADHGLTMTKISLAIEKAVNNCDPTIKDIFVQCAEAVDSVGGGSAVPLWSSWIGGMADEAPETGEAGIEEIKAFFASGFEMLDFMSGAQVGDKTMMDAVIPAQEAISAYEGNDEDQLFAAAAEAAAQGAEKTKEVPSKFGRAKYYGAKTIGTPDAGALSMAAFFKGLAR